MMDSNEIKIFNFQKICRLCLREERILIEIFESSADNNNLTIDQKINACSTVNLFRGDGLPPKICVKCLSCLNAAIKFKIQCENADKILHDVHDFFVTNEVLSDAIDKVAVHSNEVDGKAKNKKIIQISKDFNHILVVKKEELANLDIEETDSNFLQEEESERKNFDENLFFSSQQELVTRNSSEAPSVPSEEKWRPSDQVAITDPGGLQKGCEVGTAAVRPKLAPVERRKAAGDPPKSPCPFCNKMLTRVDEHVRLLHRNRVYVCTKRECGAEFSTLKNLQSHQLRCYDVEKAYKCSKCFKEFHRKSNFKAHVRRHGDKKEFQCQLCERAFVDSTGLRRHFLKHHEPEQEIFISGCCGKRFKSKEGLKKHIQKGICGFQIFHNVEADDVKENASQT